MFGALAWVMIRHIGITDGGKHNGANQQQGPFPPGKLFNVTCHNAKNFVLYGKGSDYFVNLPLWKSRNYNFVTAGSACIS